MKALESHDPKYFPKYEKPVVVYNNNLLNSLNSDRPERPMKIKYRRNQGIFKPRALRRRVQKQLEIERAGQMTVSKL